MDVTFASCVSRYTEHLPTLFSIVCLQCAQLNFCGQPDLKIVERLLHSNLHIPSNFHFPFVPSKAESPSALCF